MAGCDVFISYKRGEGAAVEPIARKLKELGLEVWYDTRLDAGPSFDEQIASKLRAAKAVLVCWTPDAIGSQWVRGEAAMAHESGKLVACFLKATKLIPPFNLIQTENLADWNGEDDHAGWAKTFARIASLSDENRLIEWATLMSEGNPKTLRAWAAKQPPGPLRVTTRYWISELDGATVAIPDAALIAARRRGVFGRLARLKWYWKASLVVATLAVSASSALAWNYFTYQPEFAAYDVIFNEPPQMTEGTEVRFNGILVGSIQRLMLDRNDPNTVIARIYVDPATPVRTDSVAQQQFNRVSGAAYIQLLAGDPNTPLLTSSSGEIPRVPTSRTAQSDLEIGQQDMLYIQGDLYRVQSEYYKLMLERLRAEDEAAQPLQPTDVGPSASTEPPTTQSDAD